jgi:hypothetical protein
MAPVLRRIRHALRVAAAGIRDVLVEHRKALAAERLYVQLRSRSPEELAKAGMSHRDLARHVYERLYADPSTRSQAPAAARRR